MLGLSVVRDVLYSHENTDVKLDIGIRRHLSRWPDLDPIDIRGMRVLHVSMSSIRKFLPYKNSSFANWKGETS